MERDFVDQLMSFLSPLKVCIFQGITVICHEKSRKYLTEGDTYTPRSPLLSNNKKLTLAEGTEHTKTKGHGVHPNQRQDEPNEHQAKESNYNTNSSPEAFDPVLPRNLQV